MPEPILIGLSTCFGTLLGVKIWKIFSRLSPYLSKALPLKLQDNQYVLVTGGTDGIGKQFVRKLAHDGINVIVSGRNQEKIKLVISEISQEIKTPVKFKSLPINFAKASKEQIDANLGEQDIQEHSIVGIINSCGASSYHLITDHPTQSTPNALSVQDLRNVNIGPLQYFLAESSKNSPFKTRLYFSNNQPIKLPFLIHISSMAGKWPIAYSAHYSGTKAYTTALLDAYSQQKLNPFRIQTLLTVEPWFVKTKMIGVRNTYDVIEPELLVKSVMKCLGKRQKCRGSVKHEAIDELLETFCSSEHRWSKLARQKLIQKMNEENFSRYQRLLKLKLQRQKKKISK